MTPPQRRVAAAGAGLAILLAAVNGIALVASYWHARIVAYRYTDHAPVAGVTPWDMTPWLPLTTDGLLLAALAVIYWRRTVDQPVHWAVLVAAGIAGFGVVGANLANAMPGIGGWIVAGWPALTVMVVDVVVAMFLPTLAAAWQAGAPVPDTEQVSAGGTAPAGNLVPPAVPPTEKPTGSPAPSPVSPRPVSPVHAVPVSALARAGGAVSVPVPDQVGRWTADDEAARAELQAAIDGGARMPTPTSLKKQRGMNTDRGKRIIARLVPPPTSGQ